MASMHRSSKAPLTPTRAAPAWAPHEPAHLLAVPADGVELAALLRTVAHLVGQAYDAESLRVDLAALGYAVPRATLVRCMRRGGELPRAMLDGLHHLTLYLALTGARPPPRMSVPSAEVHGNGVSGTVEG